MTFFICSNCGEGSASWMGRCPSCEEWNTFVEQRESSGKDKKKVESFEVKSLSTVQTLDNKRLKSGIFELDRILGGGFVKGEVVFLSGEPGVGKSTLLLQSLKNLRTLYISGEEAAEQVKDRADRLGVDTTKLMFSDTLQVEAIVKGLGDILKKIDVVVIDSIQTVYSAANSSPPGSISQLREASAILIKAAKQHKIPLILIGHITKEGDIAGPKTLEHMVDAVLQFEGDRISSYRILRAQKNRFGGTDEIGLFEMREGGLVEVTSPLVFIENDIQSQVPGKALVGVMEGKRPLFFEIQTLAAPSILAVPRRVVKGVDYNKVLLLLAVLQKHLHLSLGTYDIYLNVIGGVNIKSTAADLGIVASIISSVKNIVLPSRTIFSGEVGLLGEVRESYGLEKIIYEARRLKFTKIYSSKTIKTVKEMYKSLS